MMLANDGSVNFFTVLFLLSMYILRVRVCVKANLQTEKKTPKKDTTKIKNHKIIDYVIKFQVFLVHLRLHYNAQSHLLF